MLSKKKFEYYSSVYSSNIDYGHNHCDLVLLKYKDIYIATGYRSPRCSMEYFNDEINKMIELVPNNVKLILLSDFNDGGENACLKALKGYNCMMALITTDLNTNIDIIITNINYGKAGTYESFFSYHKPIYFYLNDLKLASQVKSKKLSNNDDQPSIPKTVKIKKPEVRIRSLVNSSSIYADFHQGDRRFGEYAGSQCTAMSIASIIKGFFKPIQDWTKEDLNEILVNGNDFYKKMIQIGRGDENGYLSIEHLLDKLTIFGMEVTLDIGKWDEYLGVYNQYGRLGIDRTFKSFFKNHDYGVIICSSYTRAIMHQNGKFYLFDSHASRESPHKAAVYKFDTVDDLINKYMTFKNHKQKDPPQFNLSHVKRK